MGFISIIIAILVILPGIFVYFNQPKRSTNILFLLMCASLSGWVITNYLVDQVTFEYALFLTRMTFLSVTLGVIIFWDFTSYFPEKLEINLNKRLLGYSSALLISVLLFTPLLIPDVEVVNGVISVMPGPIYVAFILYFLSFLFLSIRRIYHVYKHGEQSMRARAFYVLLAMGSMALIGTTTNLLLPLLMNGNPYAVIGTYSTLFFTGLISYAMLRHQLFDIRQTAARASTYLLSLVTLVALYFSLIFGLTQLFSTASTADWIIRLFYLSIAILTALTLQPIKKFFDRVTSRVFFRDAYDPQQFIDEISNQLVTHYELDKLGDSVALVIVKYLKVEFCSFYVSESAKQHLFGTKKDLAFMKADDITKSMTANMMLIDEHHENHHNLEKSLKKDIKKTGAKMVVKLESINVNIGAMFIGPKKSGSSFSQNDIRVIDILSDELALAFQNATRFEQISTFNATLQQKIEAATQELTRTNHKLQALDEAKDEFISMASHQLRTPLTSIKGYLSLVLDGDIGEITPQQRELLGQAFTSSQRMVYLIADLLNVSRLRTGKFIIESSDVQLANVVSEEMKQIQEAARAKKLKLVYKKPKSFPIMQLDDNKIRQVMMNFMDNAIYYTPNGGEIKIELIKKRSSIEFRVTDDGIGVPKAEQHKLFTKFYRAGNARSVRPDGTGLGLFMAKKVIVASGGALLFKSTESKGSMFGFTFPLSKIKTET